MAGRSGGDGRGRGRDRTRRRRRQGRRRALEAASSNDAAPEAIPVSGVAVLVVICGIVGVVMALGTNRWATRPARAFVAATTVLTAVSLVTPLIAENATTATRVVLELTTS